ncbi:hypothetical protein [Vibrio phage BONAISHI]|nr:hypothetical protein [Vibrio phage BONAISHI]
MTTEGFPFIDHGKMIEDVERIAITYDESTIRGGINMLVPSEDGNENILVSINPDVVKEGPGTDLLYRRHKNKGEYYFDYQPGPEACKDTDIGAVSPLALSRQAEIFDWNHRRAKEQEVKLLTEADIIKQIAEHSEQIKALTETLTNMKKEK